LRDAKESILKGRFTDAKAAAVAGNNAEAIDILDDLLSVDPSSLEAWTMRSLLAEGFDEKLRCFESILAIDPDNAAAKAGRDSLVAIFGTTDVVSSTTHGNATHEEQAEPPANESNVVFADFGPAESDSWAEQPAEPAMEFPANVEESESVTEPAVGEEQENEPHYSFEEPPHSFAEEVEAAAETDLAREQLGIEESPALAFSPVIVSDEEDVEPTATEPVDSKPPVEEEIPEPQPEMVEHAPAVDESADPQAETVAFSYPELSGDWGTPATRPVADGHRSDPEIPMPVIDLPPAPVSHDAASPVTFVEPRRAVHSEHETAICAFCGKENDAQSISCGRCMAVLTLSDLEMLLGNPNADKLLVRQAVEEMERYRLARQFTASELVTLGIGHLNLKNLELGYDCLSDASRMAPNDVVLAGQVNSLLIRLDEIRQQEEAHLRMPKGKSILVVDDSPTVRKLIAGKLEKCGHDVVCANDGVEAMERLEGYLPGPRPSRHQHAADGRISGLQINSQQRRNEERGRRDDLRKGRIL
jgi:CheY-like chemotaxis protein